MPSIAHYELLEKLGEGGMGAVYKARDTHLQRLVALKLLPSDKVADPERRKRFVQEARAASALNHPNIVTIHDVAVEAGVHFIAMEYVSGRTLAQAIGSRGLPIGELLPLAIQIADALAAAHASGIIHRDLKPANLMVTDQGTVKVLDFGLAKLTEGDIPGTSNDAATASDLSALSAEGTIVGTTAYMSPEQIEGRKLDARSDVFAFGVVLYEMATGRRAFLRDSTLSTLSAILRDEPPPASQIAAHLPRGLERVIGRCLKKNPAHRFQHIGDVKIALAELTEDLERDRLPSSQGTGRASGSRAATWIGVATAAAIALGGAGTAIWLWQRTTDKAAPILSGVPLTTYPGFETYPTLSPDGNQVAFAWDGEQRNNFDIYVKLVGPGTPLRLTTDPADDTSPAWSPDGRWIAFIRMLPKERAALMLVPALGGSERRLGEIAVPPFIVTPDFGYALSWSPDSASLIVTDRPSSEEPGGLFTWSVATGERRRLTTLPLSDWIDFGPALSLDGRWLAFTRFVSFGISDLYVLPLGDNIRATGEPKRVTHQNRFVTSPAWTSTGGDRCVSVGSLTGGAASLFVVDGMSLGRPESSPRRLNSIGDAGLVSISRASAGGRSRMVYTLPRADVGIWRITLPRKGGNAAAELPSAPFAFSTRLDYQPQYSPDGQRVAFVSDRSGPNEIWTCDKDGVNLVQLTSAAWPETAAPRWSPDGSLIVFHARPEGSGDIYTVPAGGGTPKRITHDAADEWGSSWSRDGRWIYFGSKRSGRTEVWKTAASGGIAVQVTTNGGMGPLESPDGRHLYYVKGPELWRIPVNGGNETRVLESLSDWSRFALTDNGIYFIPGPPYSAKTAVHYHIDFLRFSTGQVHAVAQLEKPPFLGLTVSPDGHSLLYSQIDESGTDLMLVDNFH